MARVLQVVSTLKKNGTETFIMNVFRKIRKEGYDFDFLTFTEDKEGFYEEIISYKSKVFFLPPRKRNFIDYHRQLDKFFAKHAKEYDAIHIHGMSHTSIAPIVYAKKYGIPVRILHIHGSSCRRIYNKVFHHLNKYRASNYTTHNLACSDNAMKWGFSNTRKYNATKIIPNGIDLKKFKYNKDIRNKIRKELNLDDNTIAIAHVGAFNPIKNHSFIIKLFSRLLSIKHEAKLFLVGEGPLMDDIKQQCNELGISERVEFLGRRDDVPDLLQAFDIMVMPSLHEGLPFALIEAQASSLPVVASDGISDEVILTSEIELLPLDAGIDYWVNTIINMLEHRKKREERALSENDKLKIFSIENTVNELLSIYMK